MLAVGKGPAPAFLFRSAHRKRLPIRAEKRSIVVFVVVEMKLVSPAVFIRFRFEYRSFLVEEVLRSLPFRPADLESLPVRPYCTSRIADAISSLKLARDILHRRFVTGRITVGFLQQAEQ